MAASGLISRYHDRSGGASLTISARVHVYADVAGALTLQRGSDRDVAHILSARDVPEHVPSPVRMEAAAELRNSRALTTSGRRCDLGLPDVQDDLVRLGDPDAESSARIPSIEVNRLGNVRPRSRSRGTHGGSDEGRDGVQDSLHASEGIAGDPKIGGFP